MYHYRRTLTTLSYALAIVVLWFGVSEIITPTPWESFVPGFFGEGPLIPVLVVIHGIILVICGIMFLFNFHRRIAAAAVTLLIFESIVDTIIGSGITDIAIRDVGLFGAALALWMGKVDEVQGATSNS